MLSKNHYHFILNPSPWPMFCTISSLNMVLSLLLFMKFGSTLLFLISLSILSFSGVIWWSGYSLELNFEGKTSFNLEAGLKYSMILFISSEIFFFFSFFWSYFHFFLSPVLELGLIWPPFFIQPFSCFNVPLINTLILVSSGGTITLAHYWMINKDMKLLNFFVFCTVSLGVIFTSLQVLEYLSSFFSMSDSSFGSSFFFLTGFHGIHVLLGSLFLIFSLFKSINLLYSQKSNLTFELSAWYWHFVDVVWLFLYFSLYYLNS